MEFQKLPANYNRNPSLNPNLLDIMEHKQYKHATSSHLNRYKLTPFRRPSPRKTKYTQSNRSIPFYKGAKYRNPNVKSKLPSPQVYHRRSFQNNPDVITISRPVSRLVNPHDSKKLIEMHKNVQPGTNVEVKGEVEKLIRSAQWEGLSYNLGNRYFTHLMGDFYCNLKPCKGLDGIMYITTVVDGKPMLVDHKTISKALSLPKEYTSKPCIDIYSAFIFNKNEFEIYLAFFCDSDVPPNLCSYNCGIHYKHFTPVYQLVALILRANILPKPSQDKFFDFFDFKMMFLLVSGKTDFNISYLILLNMINANMVDYMPYGLLLTSVFNIYHIPMPSSTESLSTSYIYVIHVKPQVSLLECEPQEAKVLHIPTVLKEENIFFAGNGSVRMIFNEQKLENKRLREEIVFIKGRLNYLEGVAAACLARQGNRNKTFDISTIYQVPMTYEGSLINDIDMVNGIEDMNVEFNSQGSDDVIEVSGTGFVGAMKEALK